MAAPANLLDTIRDALPGMRRAEGRVAETVLANPDEALPLNLTGLARRADVSEATIVRFCRAISCDGFADFKIRLAESLARGTPFVSEHVHPRDSAATYIAKIFNAMAAALLDAARTIDAHSVERAVSRLAGARQIVCCGMGGSGSVALDAQHKFMRLAVPTYACSDPLIARMAAAGMQPGDVLLAISNTGRTRDILDIADLAHAAGATTIAVTAPDSPLAQRCDITIGLGPLEDTEIYTPMASRIAHLTAIDALATGVTLRRGPTFQNHLATIKASVTPTRLPAGPPEKEAVG